MALKQNIRILSLSAALLLVAFGSCKKDNKILGIEVQPEDDKLGSHHLSNLPVYAHTISYDSVVSFNTSQKYLGSNIDPYFGKLDIGLHLNSNMTVTNLDFGANAELTSSEIILMISNTDYAGVNGASLTFSVYPLDTALVETRAYYTNTNNFHNKNQLLCDSALSFTTINGRPALRIPIDNVYATAILKNPQFLTDNATFQNAYRGFYITASSNGNEGVIYNCDLEDPFSGFFLRYKESSSSTDTLSFQFLFKGSKSSKFNSVKFEPVPPLSTQMNGDTILGKEATYLKGMGATRLRVQIPFLRNLSDSFTVVVNRAEIIFNVDQTFIAGSGNYNIPAKLALLPLDSLGRELLSIDQGNSINIARYDGYYNSSLKRYTFNIPLHAQAIMKGNRKNYGFNLVVADPLPPYTVRRDTYIDRVILAGSNKEFKPVLNLTYTQLSK